MQQEQLKHYRVRYRRTFNDLWQATECETHAQAVALKKQLRAQFYQAVVQYRDYHSGEWIG